MVERIPVPFRGSAPVNEWALVTMWGLINKIRPRIKGPKHFRLTVWGTKRAKPGDPLYESAFNMCKILAQHGIDIVTGGGPGVMEAANAGARASKNGNIRSIGVRVCIDGEPANGHLDKVFLHDTFACRLDAFTWMSRWGAFVVLAPGVGTLLETVYVWQLMKERHLHKDIPLILVGEEWRGLLAWMDEGMVKREDKPRSRELSNLHHVQTPEEAIPIVLEAYKKFQRGGKK